MIAIPPQSRICVVVEAIDFRNGINGLGKICRRVIHQDPTTGAIFIFKNKRNTSVKLLVYDGEAFWLINRRLSRGKLRWWPNNDGTSCSLTSKELQTILMNGSPSQAEFSSDWKRLIA